MEYTMLNFWKDKVSKLLVHYLTTHARKYEPFSITSPDVLCSVLQPGDVLLVEGNQRFSTAVKYLTQSTWSHAAFYVGNDVLTKQDCGTDSLDLIEADLEHGVHAVPLSKYKEFNTRICRPVELQHGDLNKLVSFMVNSLA